MNPCDLMTAQQLARFTIDRPPMPGAHSDGPLRGEPACNFRTSVGSANRWGFLITASTGLGLPAYRARLRANPTRRELTVQGFPATQEQQPSVIGPGNDACFVDVDVADDQMLGVQFGQIAARQDEIVPMETLCAKAAEVVEAALTTLQGQG